MLDQTLVALASAAGAAVASAAGTDAWQGLRQRVARILGRGNGTSDRALLERIDGAVVELERAEPEEREQARERVAATWQAHFHELLQDADGEDRAELVRCLNELVNSRQQSLGGVYAGDGGFAVEGTVNIRADQRSAAAGVMGDVTIGNPQQPGPGHD
ncbi:hypothetical protein AB0B50_38900 [Streptomyces sp. NPDC041068]|uniref:hypothetical protein n=1 Tax=Streptomyces sp. NPDC041068 TaxID=3155130 RepID=UPI0033CDF37D